MSNYLRGVIAVLIFVLGIFLFAFLLGETFKALIFAFIVAYFLFPFITKVESFGIPRPIVTIFIILFIFGTLITVLSYLIPVIYFDVKKFALLLPERMVQVSQALISWGHKIGFNLEEIVAIFNDQNKIISWLENNLSEFAQIMLKLSGKGILGLRTSLLMLINFFIVPVFFFFLINSYEKITSEIGRLLPEKQRSMASNYLNQFNTVLSGYLRGQIGLSLLVACWYSFFLSVAGVHFGLLIGLITGFINMVPYVGITISIIATTLSVLFYSDNLWFDIFIIILIYGFEIFFEIVYLYPRFVGKRIGLSTIEIMISLSIGVNIGGMLGAFVAVPLSAVFKVMLLDTIKYYKNSQLYKQNQL